MTASEDPTLSSTEAFLLEPHCRGMEHAPFNACLVVALLARYKRLVFAAEAGHLEAVREVLECSRPGLSERVDFRPRPSRGSAGGPFAAVRTAWQTLAAVTTTPAGRPPAIVIATADSASVLLLKMRLLTRWRKGAAVIVLHEALATLSRRRYRSRKYLGLRFALAAPMPVNLSLLTLVAGTSADVEQLVPSFSGRTASVHHPTLLSACVTSGRPLDRPFRVGFVGGGREAKGVALFLEIVTAVRAIAPHVEFELVGAVSPTLLASLPPGVRASATRLPLRDYLARISELSYVVWGGAPSHYRIVASGSLADTLGLGIPALCLQGHFVDSLFSDFGDIGHRCASRDEFVSRILAISREWPRNSTAHDAALGALRSALLPEALAGTLASLLSPPE